MLGCSGPSSTHKPGRAEPTQPAAVAPKGANPVGAAIALGTAPQSVDESGVPRLLLGTTIPNLAGATPAASARAYVTRLAAAWGAKPGAMPVLDVIGDIPVRGGTIIKLRPTIDGIPVSGGDLQVLVRHDGTLAAIGGRLYGSDFARSPVDMVDDDAGAVSRSMAHAYQASFDRRALSTKLQRSNGTRTLRGKSGNIEVQVAGARKVWYPVKDTLVAAWIVDSYAQDLRTQSPDGDGWRTIIDREGKILSHDTLKAEAPFNYRVFANDVSKQPHDGPQTDFSPHPTGTPNGAYPTFIPPSLVTVDGLNHGGVGSDPWLAAGKIETNGNNVDAYVDLFSPSGFSNGDFRASATAGGTFDRTFDTAVGPRVNTTQQMASITSAFYGINYLHDFWYDSGFTEVAGNAQDNNYGRGGEDRDAMLAEAQDFSGANNANMFTPADGIPPRMQIYTWSGLPRFQVNGGRTPAVGTAAFGPVGGVFDVTADMMLANDGNVSSPAGSTLSDGCTALVGNYTGKIVLVDRGACGFKLKTLNAQTAGAAGVIIANVATSGNPTVPPGMADDPTITTPITIGTLSVNVAEGDTLKGELAAGTVNARMSRQADYDGSLDSTLLAHEFGHYWHHRLSDCTTKLCGAMSEGWGDVLALFQLARAGDNFATGAYPFAVYVTRAFPNDQGYFGIRRAPYSANQAVNSLSFRHMADGEALPTTHPFLTSSQPNSQVHNSGEIWASAIWEGYVAIQGAGGTFEANHRKMADYLVAGLLLTAKDVTPTEARDAILAAAYAESVADHDILAAAFARRGFGSCAVSPPRDSQNNVGIVESAEVKGKAELGALVLTDDVDSCDNDGVLDGGETAKIKFPVANTGPTALTNVVATLTTATPGVTIVSAPTTIASLAAYSSMDVTVEVKLDDTATAPVAGDFTLTVTSEAGCNPTVTLPFTPRLNTDDKAMTAATDTFDAAITPWTPSTTGWRLAREAALDGVAHGDAAGTISDIKFETPALTVHATDAFTIAFSHSHDFEMDTTVWDGGVLEISTDNGVTWVDVSTLGVTPGYVATPITNTSGNPLAGRLAYSGKNAAFPATDAVTLDFGTQFASMTVKFRFRIGTDGAAGTTGWNIDDFAVTGIVGTPFPTQVADEGDCSTPTPDAADDAATPDSRPRPDAGTPNPNEGDGGCCDAGPMSTANLGLALGVLALVIRRRRRR